MKKLLLTIAAFSALTFAGIAQNDTAQPAQKLSPEQRADKQTDKVATHLNLSDAQKSAFKKLTMERINQNQPLKQKMNATKNKEERTAIQNQIKANNDKFFASVNSMLTPEQQTKWVEHRKKMEAGHKDPDHHD
jgi:periplasmic protein CpxP/Spy